MTLESLKEMILISLRNSSRDIEKSSKNAESDLAKCDIFWPSVFIGDAEDYWATAYIAKLLFPDDKEIAEHYRRAEYMREKAYRIRDRFTWSCKCKPIKK